MKIWHTLRTDNLRRRLQQSVSTWFRSASRSLIKAGLEVDPGATLSSSDPTPEAAPRNFDDRQSHIDPTLAAIESTSSKTAIENSHARPGSSGVAWHRAASVSTSIPVSQAESQLRGRPSWTRILKNTVQTMQTGLRPAGSNSQLANRTRPSTGPDDDSPDNFRQQINDTAAPHQFTNRLGSIPSDLQQAISPGAGAGRQAGPSVGPQPPDPNPNRNQSLNSTHYGITLQRTVQASQEPLPSVVARPVTLPAPTSDTTHNSERHVATANPDQALSSTGFALSQMQPTVRPVTPFLPTLQNDTFARSTSDLDKKREARTNARARSMLPPIR